MVLNAGNGVIDVAIIAMGIGVFTAEVADYVAMVEIKSDR